MNILDKIIVDKKREVILKKSIIPVSQLEASIFFEKKTISLSTNLRNSSSGIIAEHKRRSPSKAEINYSFTVEEVTKGYEDAGACAISVLTDGKYFGGSLDDLLLARATVNIPLLRKEFIVDEYQILEAKAHGADLILLIAAVLTRKEIKSLSEFAHSLNLEVLLKLHLYHRFPLIRCHRSEKKVCSMGIFLGLSSQMWFRYLQVIFLWCQKGNSHKRFQMVLKLQNQNHQPPKTL